MTDLNVLHQIFTDKVRNELKTKLADLSYLGVKEFGYRQFLSNGTTFGFCTRNFDNIKIKDARGKNLSYASLLRFYNQETANNFVVYRKSESNDRIEGFYFLSSSSSPEVIRCYIKHLELFGRFIDVVSISVNKILATNNLLSNDNNLTTNILDTRASISCKNPYCNNLSYKDLYTKILGSKVIEELFPMTVVNNCKGPNHEN